MLFDELNKYKKNDHFFFSNEGTLEEACNAPKEGHGVFLIYRLAHGNVDLVYIGSTGKLMSEDIFKLTEGGLFREIVYEKQFGRERKTSLPAKMQRDQIDAVDIYWYVTFGEDMKDYPPYVAAMLFEKHMDIYGRLPEWNRGR